MVWIITEHYFPRAGWVVVVKEGVGQGMKEGRERVRRRNHFVVEIKYSKEKTKRHND